MPSFNSNFNFLEQIVHLFSTKVHKYLNTPCTELGANKFFSKVWKDGCFFLFYSFLIAKIWKLQINKQITIFYVRFDYSANDIKECLNLFFPFIFFLYSQNLTKSLYGCHSHSCEITKLKKKILKKINQCTRLNMGGSQTNLLFC
jgi:hypothetical protein